MRAGVKGGVGGGTCFNLVGDIWQSPFFVPLPVDSRVRGNDGVACCAPHISQTETVSVWVEDCLELS